MKKKIDISDKTLRYIVDQKIKPIPKWEFVGINVAKGVLTTTTVTIIGVVVAVIIFMLRTNDFDLIYMPYLWMFVLGVGLGVGYQSVRIMKRGYRYAGSVIVIIELVLGLVLGIVFDRNSVGKRIDNKIESRLPYYRNVNPIKSQVWWNPNDGRIYGKIIKIDEQTIEISGPNGVTWKVDISGALIRGRVKLEVGETVKILGKTKDVSGEFLANEIRPWEGIKKSK